MSQFEQIQQIIDLINCENREEYRGFNKIVMYGTDFKGDEELFKFTDVLPTSNLADPKQPGLCLRICKSQCFSDVFSKEKSNFVEYRMRLNTPELRLVKDKPKGNFKNFIDVLDGSWAFEVLKAVYACLCYDKFAVELFDSDMELITVSSDSDEFIELVKKRQNKQRLTFVGAQFVNDVCYRTFCNRLKREPFKSERPLPQRVQQKPAYVAIKRTKTSKPRVPPFKEPISDIEQKNQSYNEQEKKIDRSLLESLSKKFEEKMLVIKEVADAYKQKRDEENSKIHEAINQYSEDSDSEQLKVIAEEKDKKILEAINQLSEDSDSESAQLNAIAEACKQKRAEEKLKKIHEAINQCSEDSESAQLIVLPKNQKKKRQNLDTSLEGRCKKAQKK